LCGASVAIADVQPVSLHMQDCTPGRCVPRQESQEVSTLRMPIQCRGTSRRRLPSCWELQCLGVILSPHSDNQHN
jgi:hypothetical protein